VDKEVIAENQASQKRLRSFIEQSSADDLRRQMSDGWTVAAYLAHIAFFDRRAARLIERWSKDGVSPSPLDVHAVNDAMKPAWLLLDPADASAEAIAAAEEADAAVAGLSGELLQSIVSQQAVKLNRSEHRYQHLDEFEALGG
jgi:uncharacterized damage-inducible protein DinB